MKKNFQPPKNKPLSTEKNYQPSPLPSPQTVPQAPRNTKIEPNHAKTSSMTLDPQPSVESIEPVESVESVESVEPVERAPLANIHPLPSPMTSLTHTLCGIPPQPPHFDRNRPSTRRRFKYADDKATLHSLHPSDEPQRPIRI